MSSIVLTGDTSGTVTVSAPAVAGTRTITLPAATGTAVLEDGSNNLQINSGFGSNATAYGVRAWVSIDGTGTVGINASGNVSSITDNGTGQYAINLTTAMTDTDYTVVGTAPMNGQVVTHDATYTKTTSIAPVATFQYSGAFTDYDPVHVVIVR